jgi:dTDP-4-dehydrorhamnose 3,5-epimerase-like enzyme
VNDEDGCILEIPMKGAKCLVSLKLVQLVDCKSVVTFDCEHLQNGSLVELVKEEARTRAYITTVSPGCRKGYHLHKRRSCHFVVLKGSVCINLVEGTRRRQFELNGRLPQRLLVPPGIALALTNTGDEEAWIFNYSDPPYDPADVDEQVEETFQEVECRSRLSA